MVSERRVIVITLGTYDGTEIGLSYGSYTEDWKFEVAVDELELGTNEGTKIGLKDWRVPGTTLGAMAGIPLGTYDGSDIGSPE